MKKYLILLIIPFLMMASCMEDKSAYLPQEKENVAVDAPSGETGQPTPPGENELVPGVQAVTLNVESADGTILERKFKYFMPVSINKNIPISLIFEFHGSVEYQGDIAPNVIATISIGHALNQHAVKENCIIVFPAGLPDGNGETKYVNWTDKDNNLRFVDAMINYFKAHKPLFDVNRVYSTGQSSGAIFSYVLAFERPELLAAITPRSGQMSLSDVTAPYTKRAVPIRAFNGTIDKSVSHDAAVTNIIAWAEKIGSYFLNDMQYNKADTLEIPGYREYLSRTWTGTKADIQLISLLEQDHFIALDKVLPMMWEFMSTHTMNSGSTNLFITASEVEFEADCGRTYNIGIKATAGAVVTYDVSEDWNPSYANGVLTVKAPADFYSTAAEGTMIVRAELNGLKVSRSIKFTLKPPKMFFRVGDIYYNDQYEAVGVVVWVNPKNSREAKLINFETAGKYGTVHFNSNPLGASFETLDKENGETNTAQLIAKNKTISSPNNATQSAYVWANEYSYKGVSGWYLPAINEYVEIGKNIALINPILKNLGAKELTGSICSSTTEVVDAATKKKNYYYYDFTKKTIITTLTTNEYTAYITPRAMKKVVIK